MKKLMILVSIFSLSALADHHDAHVHGKANSEITFETDKLDIDLEISAEALVGFETKPKGAAQEKALKDAIASLQDLAKVVAINGGDCKVTEHKVEVDYHKGHSDFDVDLEFTCAKPTDLASIDFVVLKNHKGIKELTVSYVSKSKQDQKVLKANETTFKIK